MRPIGEDESLATLNFELGTVNWIAMSFDDKLRQAIERGQKRGDAKAHADHQQAMTEEEFKRLHSTYRLDLSEHVESCIHRLANHFPGFRYETMLGDRGWGAACYRDDLRIARGARSSVYSRLEITVRPYSQTLHVLELTGKGTIRNKEAFNRTWFEALEEASVEKFRDLIDAWVLEYAELYAARE
jgi:hypothetical protein